MPVTIFFQITFQTSLELTVLSKAIPECCGEVPAFQTIFIFIQGTFILLIFRVKRIILILIPILFLLLLLLTLGYWSAVSRIELHLYAVCLGYVLLLAGYLSHNSQLSLGPFSKYADCIHLLSSLSLID